MPAWVWPKKKCVRHIRDRSPHTELDSRRENARAFNEQSIDGYLEARRLQIGEMANARISKKFKRNSKIRVIAILSLKVCQNLKKLRD